MPMPTPPRSRRSGRKPRRAYHHGDLRRALVQATIDLIEDRGVDNVSVRDVAKRAGVSPAAPFRHFPNRLALLTAVAEEAMDRLVEAAREAAETPLEVDNPLRRFEAMCLYYFDWAMANPTHFQILSNRHVIDFEGSTLRQRNDAVRDRFFSLLADAAAGGQLAEGDARRQALIVRAMIYGLLRMYVDGQFPSWTLPQDNALEASRDLFLYFMSMIEAKNPVSGDAA